MHSSHLLAESTETIIQQTNFLKEYLQLYEVMEHLAVMFCVIELIQNL